MDQKEFEEMFTINKNLDKKIEPERVLIPKEKVKEMVEGKKIDDKVESEKERNNSNFIGIIFVFLYLIYLLYKHQTR